MKVDSTNNNKPPMVSRIKQSVSNFGIKLKTLVSDVFQKEEIGGKYVTIDGVKYPSYRIPSCIGRDDDYKLVTWSETEFYPEDIEKMKNMTTEERMEYKCKLIEEKRFIK